MLDKGMIHFQGGNGTGRLAQDLIMLLGMEHNLKFMNCLFLKVPVDAFESWLTMTETVGSRIVLVTLLRNDIKSYSYVY